MKHDSEKYFSDLATILPNVSRETLADFETYIDLLLQWQKHINLVANATLPDIWHRHLLDSAQLFPLATKIKQGQVKDWLDVGSGGGFPGLVLAILIKHHGSGQISLIESNGKKVAFLRMVAAKLHLPVRIINQRIEASYSLVVPPDIITARALAELPKLLTLIAPFAQSQALEPSPKATSLFPDENCDKNKRRELSPRSNEDNATLALLQKGQNYVQEVEQARQKWSFDLDCHPSLVDKDSVILALRDIRRLKP